MRKNFAILALICLSACTTTAPERKPAADEGTPQIDGSWGHAVQLKDPTYTFPGDMHHPRPADGWWYAPIHTTMLKDGRIVITGWLRPKEKECEVGMGRAYSGTFILDPTKLDGWKEQIFPMNPITEDARKPADVLYCAGHSQLADGRVFYVGGATYIGLETGKEREYGLNYARILDPQANKITRVAEPSPGGPHPSAADRAQDWSWYEQGMMWYPTVLRLPGEKLLVAGGLARQTGPLDPTVQNRSLVMFDPKLNVPGKNPWNVWISHENSSSRVDISAFDYTHIWLLPKPLGQAHILEYGGLESAFALVTLDPKSDAKKRIWSPANGVRKNPDGSVAAGADTTASQLGTGEIMVMGGGKFGNLEGQRIDLYDPRNDSWRSFDTGITRIRAASTLLPDGTVMILSGERSWNGDSVGDRRQPTLFNPYTGISTNLAPWTNDDEDRGYHNFSILLRDGRLLVGGGRTNIQDGDGKSFRIGCERSDLRIYSPPYLFKGPRPEIAPLKSATLNYGESFAIHAGGPALASERQVVLMALGAETHHFDQNQRYLPLRVRRGKSGELTALAPADSQEAPEGDYFLFVISQDGVPSMGQPVHLGGVKR